MAVYDRQGAVLDTDEQGNKLSTLLFWIALRVKSKPGQPSIQRAATDLK